APLAGGEGDDHQPARIAGLEVVPECAVKVVAVLRLVLTAERGLGDAAEVADHREGDVGERELDQLALAAAAAVALGGEDSGRGQRAHLHVPSGEDAV